MSNIEFTTFEPEAKENPYTQTVEDLAALGDPNAAVKVTVKADDSQREQFKFQKAANAISKTARVRAKTENEDGTVTLVFTLTEKHKTRRGKSE